jgi:hypothetical protein
LKLTKPLSGALSAHAGKLTPRLKGKAIGNASGNPKAAFMSANPNGFTADDSCESLPFTPLASIASTTTPSHTRSTKRALFAEVSVFGKLFIEHVALKSHFWLGQIAFLPRLNGGDGARAQQQSQQCTSDHRN